jgi:Zn finger protein HypA/HybF involved in hydrogenase expression
MSVCPQCGGTDLEMVAGDEIMLESISVAATADA